MGGLSVHRHGVGHKLSSGLGGSVLLKASFCAFALPSRRHIDPNEEKVKNVSQPRPQPMDTQPPAPRTPNPKVLAPSPAAMATAIASVLSGQLTPSHADAFTITNLIAIGWGEPNNFFPNGLVEKASPAAAMPSVSEETHKGITASLHDALHDAINAIMTASSQSHTTTSKATSAAVKVSTDLFEQLQAGSHLPTAAAQVITYVAAVLSIILLLRAPSSEQEKGPDGSEGGSAWEASSSEKASPTTTGGARKRTPPAMRNTSPGMVAAMKAGGPYAGWPQQAMRVSPTPVSAPSMYPVQEAWQTFRTNPPVYRQPSEEPPAISTTSSRKSATPLAAPTAPTTKSKQSQSLPFIKPRRISDSPNWSGTCSTTSEGTVSVRAAAAAMPARMEPDMEVRRQNLQEKLWLVAQSLGPLLSVVPSGDPVRIQADALLKELEMLAPSGNPLQTQQALNTQYSSSSSVSLLGVWELVYATNDVVGHQLNEPELALNEEEEGSNSPMGPVTRPNANAPLTARKGSTFPPPINNFPPSGNPWRGSNTADREGKPAAVSAAPSASPTPNTIMVAGSGNSLAAALLHLAALLPGFGVHGVEQRLWTDVTRPGVIMVTNSLTFGLGPMGMWRVGAAGGWMDTGDGHRAQGWFDSLSLQPVRLFGWDTTTMIPQVVVALPESLRAISLWDTTYLDHETRISRGAAGTVFLFHRLDQTSSSARATTPKPVRPPATSGTGLANWGNTKLA